MNSIVIGSKHRLDAMMSESQKKLYDEYQLKRVKEKKTVLGLKIEHQLLKLEQTQC